MRPILVSQQFSGHFVDFLFLKLYLSAMIEPQARRGFSFSHRWRRLHIITDCT